MSTEWGEGHLVREDLSGIYLSLNQGVTTIRRLYGSGAKEALRIRANDFFAKISHTNPKFTPGGIDLRPAKSSGLGSLYEAGSICSIFYPRGDIPRDDVLADHLTSLLSIYFHLATKELLNDSVLSYEEPLSQNIEDLTRFREHKRIERNRRLSEQAKRAHGYVCQACKFNFEEHYGELGRGYIEAHHLTPIHQLRGQVVTLCPKKDFAVLCANCHRMIHRAPSATRVEEFQDKYIAGT